MLNFLGYGRENCLASLSLLFGVGKKAIVRMPQGQEKESVYNRLQNYQREQTDSQMKQTGHSFLRLVKRILRGFKCCVELLHVCKSTLSIRL